MSWYRPAWCAALSRAVYTHNPFYLISALLVLYGLHRSTSAESGVGEALTIGSLFGYTLLLALTGFAIVRLGKVWDDARTILLIIVLLLLAISVRFDAIALGNPTRGAILLATSLAFAVVVSESLLHGLGIRLAAMYRAPYYVLLALLFLYPILLAKLSVAGHDNQMAWGVFLFPLLASAGLLLLLPAARWGGPPGPPSGTPWTWPWYPWSLFAVLLIGICLRSYWLSVSFQVGAVSDISFRPYFLLPLGLAAAALLFELAKQAANETLARAALWSPLVFVLLAFPGSGDNPVEARFLEDLCTYVGSPIQITLGGLIAFFGLQWARGVPQAQWGLSLCLALFSWTSPQSLSLSTLSEPHIWPLATVAALQFGLGLWHNQLWRMPLAIAVALLASWEGAWKHLSPELGIYCVLHSLVIALLVAPAIVSDQLAQRIRWITAAAIPAAALVALVFYDSVFTHIPRSLDGGYLATLSAVSLLYWYRSATVAALAEGLATIVSLAIFQLRQLTALIANSVLAQGWPWLTWGLVFFAFALAISAIKGGASKTIVRRLSQLNDRLRNARPSQ